ncbi:unnamed protein product [Owenia fusiformis]|uniref:Carbohydrate kinase PfkB domain-containing protein n=1 Tax=Owenia fusiformis TaxID=6347 RepID=A0A8S4N3K1_OWEFU|nr:unnamed protein product [Owenia fusiformis]
MISVGLLALDIKSTVEYYPREDTGQRVIDQRWHRGGNASNTSTVLSLLGHKSAFVGTVARSHELSFLEKDFKKYDINIDRAIVKADCSAPTSICIINQQNGSRTILHHNKDLPELSCEEFKQFPLDSGIKWIHFEGRPNTDQIVGMLQHVETYNKSLGVNQPRIVTSVEFEKKREFSPIETFPDYLFISKEHAQFHGLKSKEQAVEFFVSKIKPSASVICAWSEDGAIAITKDSSPVTSAIFPPPKVIDTLGAGDTFNAATISALSKGHSLKDSITYGCKIAGAKCGIEGFDKLSDVVSFNVDTS